MATKTANLEEVLIAGVNLARATEPPADEGVEARSLLPHIQRCSHIEYMVRDHRNARPRRTHRPWCVVPAQEASGSAGGRLKERLILLESIFRAPELDRKVLPRRERLCMLIKGGHGVCGCGCDQRHLPLAVGAWRGKHHRPVAVQCVGVVPADTKGCIPAALCLALRV